MSGDRPAARQIPVGGIAGRLSALADAVRRLPPPGHRDPERLRIDKTQIASESKRASVPPPCRPNESGS